MKKFLVAALVAAGLTMTTPTTNATAFEHHPKRPCTGWQYDLTRPDTRTIRGPRLVRCVFTEVGLASQAGTAVAIAARETGNTFDPTAYNTSGCGGLFQHMLRYWEGRKAAYLPERLWPRPGKVSWTDALANTWVAAEMVKDAGWGPWSL
jgi:hypothetical protein